MNRLFVVCGLAALSLAIGSPAESGFGHLRRHADPGCAAPVEPCIKYHHKHAHKHMCGKSCCEQPTYETVLNPTSPETCQTVAVPVCLPACCQGCPCETSRCTLLGCGQVRYDYACGCSVIIRFAKHGDIHVTYVGF